MLPSEPAAVSPTPCAIALGSNLGDSRYTLEQAIVTLSQTPGISLLARSHWYQTTAIGPPQPDYLNGCVTVQTTLLPHPLLNLLLSIEQQFGRERRERWGPRTLDLDLLLWADCVLNTPTLTLPHPRMAERAFVLVPLAEIAPDWLEPLSGMEIAALAGKVDRAGVKMIKN